MIAGSRGVGQGSPNVGAEISADAVAFGAAVLREQRRLGVVRLSVPMILWVAKTLGYEKVAEPVPVERYRDMDLRTGRPGQWWRNCDK
jgi:hypothetical protein